MGYSFMLRVMNVLPFHSSSLASTVSGNKRTFVSVHFFYEYRSLFRVTNKLYARLAAK